MCGCSAYLPCALVFFHTTRLRPTPSFFLPFLAGTSRFGVYCVSLEGSQDVGVRNTGGKWRQVEKHSRKWCLLIGSEPSGALSGFRRGSGEPSQVQSIRTINRAWKQLAGWVGGCSRPRLSEPVLEPHRNSSNPSRLFQQGVLCVCYVCTDTFQEEEKWRLKKGLSVLCVRHGKRSCLPQLINHAPPPPPFPCLGRGPVPEELGAWGGRAPLPGTFALGPCLSPGRQLKPSLHQLLLFLPDRLARQALLEKREPCLLSSGSCQMCSGSGGGGSRERAGSVQGPANRPPPRQPRQVTLAACLSERVCGPREQRLPCREEGASREPRNGARLQQGRRGKAAFRRGEGLQLLSRGRVN